ncbi:MAG: hypothetical protein NC911_10395, partial [Candidatus Omnitrophica bacterium]|nr:hypothetical protein [Candidatus Omnitrophota bacterium]
MRGRIASYLLIVVLLTGGCGHQESPVSLPLSEKEIQEAISYGTAHSQETANELLSEWTVDLGYEQGKGRAVLITPFARVALLAWQAARKGEPVNRRVVEIALRQISEVMVFRVSLYGDEPNFCRQARFELVSGNKQFLPISSYVPVYGDFTRDYYIVATGEVKFNRKDIPVDDLVKLQVTIPGTK